MRQFTCEATQHTEDLGERLGRIAVPGLYVVLEGRGELTIGDESAEVGPGDVALAEADVVHALRNPGPERLVVLIVMSPPPG